MPHQTQADEFKNRHTYAYTGASPLVQSLSRPDGAVTTYEYDILNRLTQMTTRVGETVISSYAYTYNAQDLRNSEAAVEPAAPAPYTDALVNYTYNNVNALTQLTDPGTKNFTHDASGNLTQGNTPEGYAFTAAYDGSNRLMNLTYTDGAGVVNKSEYYYLGKDLLRKKNFRNSVLVSENRFIFDGDLPAQERDKNNNLTNEYTWGLGLPGGIGGLLHLNQLGVSYSYLYDGKGNVTALLDGVTAQVAKTYQYDPFGKLMATTGIPGLNQPFQFSTKPYDEKTGLSYYGYRFYVPGLGRWLTRDPIGEIGGINLYGFVRNNPVIFIDADGRFGLVGMGIGAVIGGVSGFLGELGNQTGGAIRCGGKDPDWGAIGKAALAGAVGGAIVGGFFPSALAIQGSNLLGGIVWGGATYTGGFVRGLLF